jgi:signal transduction histidine kinase
LVRLDDLVLQAVERFRVRFLAKDIAVVADVSAAFDLVSVDAAMLTQVCNNLLENAWQYAPPGGKVRITSEKRDNDYVVIVANTGEQIDAEDLPLIFERFFRVEKSRSSNVGGAGIGLAIVKGIIEAHGGAVGAESTMEETRVWFRVPK